MPPRLVWWPASGAATAHAVGVLRELRKLGLGGPLVAALEAAARAHGAVGIQLGVRRALNRDLDGITVAIQGVGHVGAYLAEKLHAAGAVLTIADVNQTALQEVAAAKLDRIELERTRDHVGVALVAPGELREAEAA